MRHAPNTIRTTLCAVQWHVHCCMTCVFDILFCCFQCGFLWLIVLETIYYIVEYYSIEINIFFSKYCVVGWFFVLYVPCSIISRFFALLGFLSRSLTVSLSLSPNPPQVSIHSHPIALLTRTLYLSISAYP